MHSVVQEILIAYGRQHVVLTVTKAGSKFVGRVAAKGARRARRWPMEFSADDPGSVVELAVNYVLERQREQAGMSSSGRKDARRTAA